MGWNNESGDPSYSDDDIEEMIDERDEAYNSPVCMAVYGHDGTGKSGIALDQLTDEEKEDGYKVAVIDWDGTASPIKYNYHNDTVNEDERDNIIIFNPISTDENGDRDYEDEFQKTMAFIRWVNDNAKEEKIKTLVIDGLFRLLKSLEMRMKVEQLGQGENERVPNQFEWSRRNQPFMKVLLLTQNFPGRRIFTTHLKAKTSYENGTVITEGWEPYWIDEAVQLFFQKVRLKKNEREDGMIEIKGKVKKSKSDSTLEGNEYTVMKKGSNGEVTWNGLNELFDEIES